MIINKFFILLTILIFCYSCRNNGITEETTVYKSYRITNSSNGGKLSSTDYISSENYFFGPRISYFRNGRVKSIVYMYKSRMDGTYNEYFNDGTAAISGTYKDGLQDGKWFYFFQGGRLKSIENWKDNKQIGDQYEYDSIGHLVLHSFFNAFGDYTYFKEFDTSGNVTKQMGRLLNCRVFDKYDNLNVGDDLGLTIYVPDDTFSRRLEVTIEKEKKVISAKKYTLFNNYSTYFSFEHLEKGTYKVNVNLFKEINGMKIGLDSSSTPLFVK